MTIDKAIEILTEKAKHPYSGTRLAYPDALKLGIEALKRILDDRKVQLNWVSRTLPGETDK